MDVLLINPPTCDQYDLASTKQLLAPAPPLGLGYLAAVLERAGYCTAIMDMTPDEITKEDLIQCITTAQPRIVGITTVMTNYNTALKVARLVKDVNEEIKVVMGGPHVSFLAQQTLEHPCVDFVIEGEGEESIVELTQSLLEGRPSLDEIKGLSFRQHGVYTYTGRRSFLKDLDAIPFPARDKLNLSKYLMPGTIITSRGCPSRCIFCAANKLYDGTCRFRSIDNILAELEILHREYHVKEFFIADDTFTVSRKRVMEFCDRLIAGNLGYSWTCESRVDTIDEALLTRMKESGCTKIQFGVESGVQQIVNRIHKGIQLEDVEKRVQSAANLGIQVICSFIIGHPDDTIETVEETIAFAKQLKSYSTELATVKNFFSLLTPLPGTYVYDNLEELGITLLSTNWDRYVFHTPVIRTRHLSERELYNLYLQALGA